MHVAHDVVAQPGLDALDDVLVVHVAVDDVALAGRRLDRGTPGQHGVVLAVDLAAARRRVVRGGAFQETPGRDVELQRVGPGLRDIRLLRRDLLEERPGHRRRGAAAGRIVRRSGVARRGRRQIDHADVVVDRPHRIVRAPAVHVGGVGSALLERHILRRSRIRDGFHAASAFCALAMTALASCAMAFPHRDARQIATTENFFNTASPPYRALDSISSKAFPECSLPSGSLGGRMVTRPAAAMKPPLMAGDRVHVRGLAVHGVHAGLLETFADLRGNPDGGQVVGGDQADDTGDRCVGPGPFEGGGRRLGRKPEAPPGSVDDPAEIDTRPGLLRMVEADTANHLPCRLLHNGPLTVTAQLPLANHLVAVLCRQFQAARRFEQRDLLPRDDVRIPDDAHESLRVRQLGDAEQEALGFDVVRHASRRG